MAQGSGSSAVQFYCQLLQWDPSLGPQTSWDLKGAWTLTSATDGRACSASITPGLHQTRACCVLLWCSRAADGSILVNLSVHTCCFDCVRDPSQLSGDPRPLEESMRLCKMQCGNHSTIAIQPRINHSVYLLLQVIKVKYHGNNTICAALNKKITS